MRFAMASRTDEDDDAFLRDADAYCEENFGSTHESLRVFSRFALRLERVELVWCPFKRCAEDYYRNADERYRRQPSPENEEALYERASGPCSVIRSSAATARRRSTRNSRWRARTRDRSTRGSWAAACNDPTPELTRRGGRFDAIEATREKHKTITQPRRARPDGAAPRPTSPRAPDPYSPPGLPAQAS